MTFKGLTFGLGLGMFASALVDASFIQAIFINIGANLIGFVVEAWIEERREEKGSSPSLDGSTIVSLGHDTSKGEGSSPSDSKEAKQ